MEENKMTGRVTIPTDLDVASKIKIYLMRTDEKLNPMEAIVKTGERESLYDALDLAKAWLDRAERETA